MISRARKRIMMKETSDPSEISKLPNFGNARSPKMIQISLGG